MTHTTADRRLISPDGQWLIFHKDDAGCPECFADLGELDDEGNLSGGPWYYEPNNPHGGDDVYSLGYPTKEAALDAAEAEEPDSEEEAEYVTGDEMMTDTVNRTALEHIGWGRVWSVVDDPEILATATSDEPVDPSGYNAAYYWEGDTFRGPDSEGIVPLYQLADGSLFPADATPLAHMA